MFCKDCKHWRLIRDEDFETKTGEIWKGPHGECHKIDEFSIDTKAWTCCIDNNACGNCYENSIECAKCKTEPYHEPNLITKEDFGCVLFEQK